MKQMKQTEKGKIEGEVNFLTKKCKFEHQSSISVLYLHSNREPFCKI